MFSRGCINNTGMQDFGDLKFATDFGVLGDADGWFQK